MLCLSKHTVLLFLSIFTCLCATGNELTFKYLTPEDGLNEGTINCIAQDASGVMWFATFDGLISYDGFKMHTYKPEIDNPRSLTARQVRGLVVDSHNNIWIATDFGICRYNRTNDDFDRFILENYPGEKVYSIRIVEIENTLIVKTQLGLYYYPLDNESGNFQLKPLRYFDEDEQGFNNLGLIDRKIDEQLVLVGYPDSESSILYFAELIKEPDNYTFRFRNNIISEGIVIDAMLLEKDHLYVATEKGVYLVQMNQDPQMAKPIIREPGVTRMHHTSDHKIWIQSNLRGIGRYDLHNGTYERIQHDPNQTGSLLGDIVNSLYEDFSGNIWIGHSGDGLSILNLKKKAFHTVRYDPGQSSGITSNTIFCFQEAGDKILIGTDYGGLNIMRKHAFSGDYEIENVVFPNNFIFHPDYNSVWCIAKESATTFWLGTNFGLIKTVKTSQGWRYTQFPCQDEMAIITSIFIDPNGNMWLGTYRGLFLWTASRRDSLDLYHYNHESRESGALSDFTITDILLDSKNRFWIGTQNGGLNLLQSRYDNLNLSGNTKPDLVFKSYIGEKSKPSGLNNNEINCLLEYFDGTIWCGTQGGGINILDPDTDNFKHITTENGLEGHDVFGILPDDRGRLWISTNRGLSMMHGFSTGEDIINFTPKDGIQGNVHMVNSYYKGDDGTMYFGGRRGFTFFHPDEIEQNLIPPRIHLTDLFIDNKLVEIGDSVNGKVMLRKSLNMTESITLSHKDYSFSIGLAAIHYDEPEENKIMYRLDGLENDWFVIPSSRQTIQYTNLSHGTYVFRAKAVSSDNIESNASKTLTIFIKPPWYKAWYGITFFAILGITILIGLGLLIRHRAILQHNLQLQELEKDNIEKVNEAKLKFFTDISHELKTPLSLIIAPLEDLAESQSSFNEQYFRKQSNLILRNARLLKRLIDQIITFRKMSSGKLTLHTEKRDIGQFIGEIIKNFEIYKNNKKLQLIHHIPDDPLMVWFDANKLEKILYNLFSNAFKHVSDKGLIMISLEEGRKKTDYYNHAVDGVIISVYNEGKGIPEDKINRIFERFYHLDNLSDGSGIGLALTKSLVELHKGSIEVESVENDGVTFSIFIPKNDSLVKEKQESEQEMPEAGPYPYFDDGESLKIESLESFTLDKGLKVLLIEDNLELRDFLRTILERYYEFHEAADGNAGLELAGQIIPDLIISDVIMPGKDGFEVCRELKENVRTCHIPVLLLTAKSAPEHMIDGYDSGADAYVAKPFEIKVLLTQVSRLIKNRELIRSKYRQQNFMIDILPDPSSKDDRFLQRLNEEIYKNISDPEFNVSKLSNIFDLSPTQIYRKIKALTGCSSVEYIRIIKLNKAVELLKTNKYSVKEVCYKSGFNDPSYFVRCFKEHFKATPSEFKYLKLPSSN